MPFWSEFGSEAAMWIYMAENGLKMSDEVRQSLYKEAAELQNSDITDSNTDVIEDMEKYIIPILKDDNEETVQSKIDYNLMLATNIEMQRTNTAKLLSKDKISKIWDLTSEPEGIQVDSIQVDSSLNDKVTEAALEQLPGAITALNIEPEKEKNS